jgi:O-succinylbenzoic acid--CoA ligase
MEGCGDALPHAQLRLAAGSGALQIRAASLALGFLQEGKLQPLPLDQGWWSSGDRAEAGAEGWQLLGRLDGAIHSGGETVFPEQVEQRLLELARAQALPVDALLVLPEADPLWGERLVALVKPAEGIGAVDGALRNALQTLARGLPPSQRPRRWLHCPQLQRNPLGKWARPRWIQWLASQPASQP